MKDFKFFTQPIFYGDGQSTLQDIEELKRQIEEVQSINSGMQQPCHCEDPCKCSSSDLSLQTEKEQLGKSIKKALDI